MPTVVVPFRGAEGKSRLVELPHELRAAVAEAMLADVLAACAGLGSVYVVSSTYVPLDGLVTLVAEPGDGQGAAVRAALDAAAGDAAPGPYLVVNADLPCATAGDLAALADAVPAGGLALVAAADGTTNALALASTDLYAPLYGPGSAERFAALADSRTLVAPNLSDDVDTVDDLERLRARVGPSTRRVLSRLRLGAAA
jgi:2-phospho-L-lactate guanylyltransferase